MLFEKKTEDDMLISSKKASKMEKSNSATSTTTAPRFTDDSCTSSRDHEEAQGDQEEQMMTPPRPEFKKRNHSKESGSPPRTTRRRKNQRSESRDSRDFSVSTHSTNDKTVSRKKKREKNSLKSENSLKKDDRSTRRSTEQKEQLQHRSRSRQNKSFVSTENKRPSIDSASNKRPSINMIMQSPDTTQYPETQYPPAERPKTGDEIEAKNRRRFVGVLKSYSQANGYGFLASPQFTTHQRDVFVHKFEVELQDLSLIIPTRTTAYFDILKKNGRPQAVNCLWFDDEGQCMNRDMLKLSDEGLHNLNMRKYLGVHDENFEYEGKPTPPFNKQEAEIPILPPGQNKTKNNSSTTRLEHPGVVPHRTFSHASSSSKKSSSTNNIASDPANNIDLRNTYIQYIDSVVVPSYYEGTKMTKEQYHRRLMGDLGLDEGIYGGRRMGVYDGRSVSSFAKQGLRVTWDASSIPVGHVPEPGCVNDGVFLRVGR